jgi:hypothetical protein
MVTFKAREVLNGLERKGFQKSERDHTFLILFVNGKKTSIYTKVSHGSNEIDDYLIHKMSLQVRLDKKQFIDLINCPFTYEEYLEELKIRGYSFS